MYCLHFIMNELLKKLTQNLAILQLKYKKPIFICFEMEEFFCQFFNIFYLILENISSNVRKFRFSWYL